VVCGRLEGVSRALGRAMLNHFPMIPMVLLTWESSRFAPSIAPTFPAGFAVIVGLWEDMHSWKNKELFNNFFVKGNNDKKKNKNGEIKISGKIVEAIDGFSLRQLS
jgi:hypothetical protein